MASYSLSSLRWRFTSSFSCAGRKRKGVVGVNHLGFRSRGKRKPSRVGIGGTSAGKRSESFDGKRTENAMDFLRVNAGANGAEISARESTVIPIMFTLGSIIGGFNISIGTLRSSVLNATSRKETSRGITGEPIGNGVCIPWFGSFVGDRKNWG